MSTQPIKFYSKGYASVTEASGVSTTNAGAVVFDKTSKSIFVNGVQYGGSSVKDATFGNNTLKIWKNGDAEATPSITLDFSTLATIKSVLAVFNQLEGMIDVSTTAGAYIADADTSYVKTDSVTSLNTTNVISVDNDSAAAAIQKLDNKGKVITSELIDAKKDVSTIASTIGLNDDYSVSFTATGLTEQTTLKGAIEKLATDGGKIDDVKLNGTTVVVNKVADISVDGTYNAATNKLATVSTVTTAIDNLDYNAEGTANLATVADNVITIATTIKQENGTIAVSGTQALAAVAKTGNASDVTYGASNVSSALDTINGDENTEGSILNAVKNAAITIDGFKGAITTGNGLTDVAADNGSFAVKPVENGYISVTADGVNVTNTKAATDTTTYNNTNIALASYVDEEIAKAVKGGVQYKGTVTNALPANPVNGDMYKTTADSGDSVSPAWKSGDVIIYHQDGDAAGTWDVIPAGDDVEYTGIKVGDTTVINATTGGDATFAAGHTSTADGYSDLITVVANGTTITYKSTETLETAVANANSAVQSVSGETAIANGNTDYVAVAASTTNNAVTISSTVKTQDVSTATDAANGLATAKSVKEYVDANVGVKQVVNPETQTGNITVTASTDNGIVTVSATASEATVTDGVVADGDGAKLVKAQDVAPIAQKAIAVEDKAATITVNADSSTTIATVNGTDVTVKAALYWDEWE